MESGRLFRAPFLFAPTAKDHYRHAPILTHNGFEEVETPILQISPCMEPHVHAFGTRMREPFDPGPGEPLYLHTSPEFAMKKLLVAGVPKLFQLAHVFRNAERSRTHHPEFLMLEWYRAHAGYGDLIEDCIGLLRATARALGKSRIEWRGHVCHVFEEWERLTVCEAFERYADIDLMQHVGTDPHQPDPAVLAGEAERIGIRVAADDSWEDIVLRILGERIEPHLGLAHPTVLMDYPISMAALSRPKPRDPRLAERFELYVCGLELANAFGELIDPEQQRARFSADMDLRERLYGDRYPVDQDFLAALEHGMPPSAGIALGFDRLVMLLTGAGSIDDVLWCPVASVSLPQA